MRNGHDVAALAVGKWRGILSALGVEQKYLGKRNGPCPICRAGKDRYRFTDHESRGMWVCSHCGAGDGFKLLMELKGWDFKTAASEVGAIVGAIERTPPAPKPDQAAECRAIWKRSVPVSLENASGLYLHRRLGLMEFPRDLRHVESLRYEEDGKPASWHTAMIALVRDASGQAVSLHRTYLSADGSKAPLGSPKKLMRGLLPKGSAIRLVEPSSGILGLSEGIETALAAGLRFGVAVWAAISANGMATWSAPLGVTKLRVFGDCDESFTGQHAAYACARLNYDLAKRRKADLEISVEIPPHVGDWADSLQSPPHWEK